MNRGTTQKGDRVIEEDGDLRRTREREEIAARVAIFKATQRRFEREREEYFLMTLARCRVGNRFRALERAPSLIWTVSAATGDCMVRNLDQSVAKKATSDER
jgi:hypothetical protein